MAEAWVTCCAGTNQGCEQKATCPRSSVCLSAAPSPAVTPRDISNLPGPRSVVRVMGTLLLSMQGPQWGDRDAACTPSAWPLRMHLPWARVPGWARGVTAWDSLSFLPPCPLVSPCHSLVSFRESCFGVLTLSMYFFSLIRTYFFAQCPPDLVSVTCASYSSAQRRGLKCVHGGRRVYLSDAAFKPMSSVRTCH